MKSRIKNYKTNKHFVTIEEIGDKQMNLFLIDLNGHISYANNNIKLICILTKTVQKAFENQNQKIKVTIEKTQNNCLQISVLVRTQFLKPIIEKIILHQKQKINLTNFFQKQLNLLSQKSALLHKKNQATNKIYCSVRPQMQYFESLFGPVDLCPINLKKGKYLLTFSCLLFIQFGINTWIQIYFKNEQFFMYGGYYQDSSTQVKSLCLRKLYEVTQQQELLSFQFNQPSEQILKMQNAVMIAKRLS